MPFIVMAPNRGKGSAGFQSVPRGGRCPPSREASTDFSFQNREISCACPCTPFFCKHGWPIVCPLGNRFILAEERVRASGVHVRDVATPWCQGGQAQPWPAQCREVLHSGPDTQEVGT